jgi:hypothetical protein
MPSVRRNAMAYEGDFLHFCPQKAFALGHANAVVVTGDPPNTWGHMLLNTGGIGGVYFQVAGVHACPRYLNELGYRRYLKETGKQEIRRLPVRIRNPDAAQLKLEELLSKPWSWWVVRHNCETFVEEIIVAGGGRPIHQGLFYKPVVSRQQTPGATGRW